jgi:hypothetical protein
MYVLWGIFVFSYVGRAFVHPLYAGLVALLVVAYGVRVAAVLKRRAATHRVVALGGAPPRRGG